VSYDDAEKLQEKLRSEFLAWKSRPELSASVSADCPRPHLISFESTPTYTLGRRQEDLTPDQAARLRRDLRVDLTYRHRPVHGRSFTPEIRKTNRGGLTTYHGPGQIVFWPVLDMHSPLYARYGVASYASHLESTTQRLLAEIFGIRTYISRDEPGVWVDDGASSRGERKIAALGVHHRRHVTALGIALNIDIPVGGDEDVNPWARFVPCGLDGKLVTSVAAELQSSTNTSQQTPWDLSLLAARWAKMFEEGLLDASKRIFDVTGKGRSP
jgi:lipoyl(octanoyl) transferase